MSKFWGDFGQAFLPAYGQSTQRTDRLAATEQARADRLAAAELAREQLLDDRRKEREFQKRMDDQRRQRIAQQMAAEAAGITGKQYAAPSQVSQAFYDKGAAARAVGEEARKREKEDSTRQLQIEAAREGAYLPGDPLGVVTAQPSDPALAARIGEIKRKRDDKLLKDKNDAAEALKILGLKTGQGTESQQFILSQIKKSNPDASPQELAELFLEYTKSGQPSEEIFYGTDGKPLFTRKIGKGSGSSPSSGKGGLSTKQKEALDASEIALAEAQSLLDEFGEDASKNLNIWNRATHKIKNIALPAAGIDNWADPKMASYRARAEKLSGQALAAMHKMHGGGMMSAADVVLYGKGIPNTDTYSPVAYNAKFKAWQQSMEGLVNYYKAKETMADLPAYISDLNPELAFKIAGQKDPKTNKTILDKNTLKFLMGNSPNFKISYDEVMDLVKNKNITFDQGADWIEAQKIDVPNRR
tara:strand:- start:3934 stop:5349 length:1416 start_codon:yes stop_codon:yes gene_type:complete